MSILATQKVLLFDCSFYTNEFSDNIKYICLLKFHFMLI